MTVRQVDFENDEASRIVFNLACAKQDAENAMGDPIAKAKAEGFILWAENRLKELGVAFPKDWTKWMGQDD